MSGRIITLLAFLLLLSSVAYAANFTITISPVKDEIFPSEVAEFKLFLTSDSKKIEFFNMYSDDVLWDITTDPADAKNRLKMYPFGTSEVRIFLTPSKQLPIGMVYGVPIVITSLNEMKKSTQILRVFLRSPAGSKGAYVPAVTSRVQMPSVVNPLEDIKIIVELSNKNNLNISDVVVTIRGALINKSYKTTLDPLESKVIDFTVRLDPSQEPRKDVLYVQITANGEEFEPKLVSYEVGEYGGVTESSASSKGFLSRTTTVTVSNAGNAQRVYEFKAKMPFLKGIFTSSEPDAKAKSEDGVRYISWEFVLDKNSKVVVSYTTSYQSIFWVIVVAGIVVALYYILRSQVTVRKSVRILMKREGGISELVVQLDVKNRSGKSLTHLNVIDRIPHLVELIKEEKPGIIQPSKILHHDKKGAILEWDIGNIDPFEERVISYKVRAKLIILGRLSLPIALAKFRLSGETKEHVTTSNRVGMLAE